MRWGRELEQRLNTVHVKARGQGGEETVTELKMEQHGKQEENLKAIAF